LAARFGIREIETLARVEREAARTPDPKEPDKESALQSEILVAMGGKYEPDLIPLRAERDAQLLFGFRRCVGLEAADARALARHADGLSAVVEKRVGRGKVLYAGTTFGALLNDPAKATGKCVGGWLSEYLAPAARATGTRVHVDRLEGPHMPLFVVVAGEESSGLVSWRHTVSLRGVFTGIEVPLTDGRICLEVEAGFADLLVTPER
jgi:hypothetical protein